MDRPIPLMKTAKMSPEQLLRYQASLLKEELTATNSRLAKLEALFAQHFDNGDLLLPNGDVYCNRVITGTISDHNEARKLRLKVMDQNIAKVKRMLQHAKCGKESILTAGEIEVVLQKHMERRAQLAADMSDSD